MENSDKCRGQNEILLLAGSKLQDPIPVLIVEGKGIAELRLIGGGGIRSEAAEGGELGEADETVPVGVNLRHGETEVSGGGLGAEGGEDLRELREGDLAVTVGVELVEDLLELRLRHALEVRR